MWNAAFLPDGFAIPNNILTEDFEVRLLTVADLFLDYDAYMSSIEHVQQVFDTRGAPWPARDTTLQEALADLAFCEWEHDRRQSFSYGVFSRGEPAEELGCIYVTPTEKPGCDAQVFVWGRQSAIDRDHGFEDALLEFAAGWVARDWPFAALAYPGRKDSWQDCARPPLVQPGFAVPGETCGPGFWLRPVTMNDFLMAKPAYQQAAGERARVLGGCVSSGQGALLSLLGWHEWDRYQKGSFAYAVLSPPRDEQLGCLYVMPPRGPDFDAAVDFWVTETARQNGLGRDLRAFAESFLARDWPFERVAFLCDVEGRNE